MTGTVLLVRHGQTTWNRDGRVQGWADSTLTGRGREQARAVGSHLTESHDLDRLVVSDLQRTRETAELLRESGVDLEPSLSRAWRERDFGELQGLTRTEITDRYPEFDPDGSLLTVESVEGGESLQEFEERVLGGWTELVDGLADGETIVVVTHGGPIRAAIASVTGRDLPAVAPQFSPSNCGLTAIECGDQSRIVGQDQTDHLSVCGRE